MFSSKKTSLFTPKAKESVVGATKVGKDSLSVKTANVSSNPFVKSGLGTAAKTLSGNNALKFSTSGNPFVDQFNNGAKYKAPRPYTEIAKDMGDLWASSPELAVRFLFYLRMITRTVVLPDGTKTERPQKGQGLKHEGIMRLLWLAINQPEIFWKNINLFIAVGSWKDIFTILSYDLVYHGWDGRVLDWTAFGNLLLAGLENPGSQDLVKKYLPQIKANSACKTVEAQADNVIAKWIASLLFGGKEGSTTYKAYRKLKTSGEAHEWQKLISQGKFLKIDFKSIHGRALAQLVSSKFLKNAGLEEKYQKWIESQPVAKFTGYVFELAQSINTGIKTYQKQTIDAQFKTLVEVAKKGLDANGLRPIGVSDTSGSMSSPMYIGNGQVGKLKSIEVAMSSILFFNEMMPEGPFKNYYLEFSNGTTMKQIVGNGFVDQYTRLPKSGYGGTNFESVFQFFADFKRKNPKVSEDQIPNFIVAFSDGEFNSVSTGLVTNVIRGRQILKQAGYSKNFYENFGICFVDLPNTFYSHRPATKFETFGDVRNVFYFSGYDLSPLGFLFGTSGSTGKIPSTASELVDAALTQEVLELIQM